MSKKLKVTMFDVGFGDCFLVEIPLASRPFRMLFDCGRHKGGKPENQALATNVIAAAKDADGVARIDVVVGTHRHKDHVSGFAADGWDKVEVREVWLPWTEDPTDPKARGLVARQLAAAATALQAAKRRALGADAHSFGLLELALTNEAAMETLYGGFRGAGGAAPVRRYLPDPDEPLEPLIVTGAPGARFHILGPTRKEEGLATMDPPKAETFRKLAAAAGANGRGDKLVPFSNAWTRTSFGPSLDPDDEQQLQHLSTRESLRGLSEALDNAINNTSLVIMIEVGAARLLFCADAQWGNWRAILGEPHWRALIATTTFLKVGHHASHNASPVTLINELLPKGIFAMVSVKEGDHHGVPNAELEGAFVTRNFKVVRSDEPAGAPSAYKVEPDRISLQMPF